MDGPNGPALKFDRVFLGRPNSSIGSWNPRWSNSLRQPGLLDQRAIIAGDQAAREQPYSNSTASLWTASRSVFGTAVDLLKVKYLLPGIVHKSSSIFLILSLLVFHYAIIELQHLFGIDILRGKYSERWIRPNLLDSLSRTSPFLWISRFVRFYILVIRFATMLHGYCYWCKKKNACGLVSVVSMCILIDIEN